MLQPTPSSRTAVSTQKTGLFATQASTRCSLCPPERSPQSPAEQRSAQVRASNTLRSAPCRHDRHPGTASTRTFISEPSTHPCRLVPDGRSPTHPPARRSQVPMCSRTSRCSTWRRAYLDIRRHRHCWTASDSRVCLRNCSAPAGHTHGYGPVFGDAKLRQAVARDINRVYRTPGKGDRHQVTEENVGITAGCNLAFTAVATAIAGPGDALIVCDPWYLPPDDHDRVRFQIAGVHTKPPHFYPDLQMIRALLASDNRTSTKTIKGVVLVTPNNPTGAIYPPDLIRDIAVLCKEYGVALILDETYRDFLLTGSDADGPAESSSLAASAALPHNFARPHDLFEDAPPGLAERAGIPTGIGARRSSSSSAFPRATPSRTSSRRLHRPRGLPAADGGRLQRHTEDSVWTDSQGARQLSGGTATHRHAARRCMGDRRPHPAGVAWSGSQ